MLLAMVVSGSSVTAPALADAPAATRQVMACSELRDSLRKVAMRPGSENIKVNCGAPAAGQRTLAELYASGWTLRASLDLFRPGGDNSWDSFLFIFEK